VTVKLIVRRLPRWSKVKGRRRYYWEVTDHDGTLLDLGLTYTERGAFKMGEKVFDELTSDPSCASVGT
jgi:hypothetical protein